ncbi:DUF6678 family protein [Hymenobacter sp. HSC-4F20]|uniref:DUF6678 family protein n=1 Tax=Hymenobacter sp. HSC-4F20 TaxID=2864135 RepID=UPI0038F724FB
MSRTSIEVIESLINSYSCELRLKTIHEPEPAGWCRWIIQPVPGYIESSTAGPCPAYEVEWVDINPIVTIHIGRLVKDKYVNYQAELEAQLTAARVAWQHIDGLLRIHLLHS